MAGYGILVLLVGISLIMGVAALCTGLHRRTGAAYALLTVGILTAIPALLIQVILLWALPDDLLGILVIKALVLGLLAGFIQEPARLVGYQVLAPGAVTRSHALMIGLGFGLPVTGYTALIAFGLGWALLGYGTEQPDSPAALASGAAAEACNGLLPLVMHMALSWLVLNVFLRGQVHWLFLAILAHSIVVMMATLLGPGDAWAVVVWRGLVALVSVAVIVRLRAPVLSTGGDDRATGALHRHAPR